MRGFWLLLLVAPVAANPFIVAVVPEAPDGNAEAIRLAAHEPTQWGDYVLSDGEDTLTLPSLIASSLWVGHGDLTPWGGPKLDVTWDVQLSNAGETLQLLRDGIVVDEVGYGKAGLGSTSAGMVHQRAYRDGWVDTNQATDFQTPRIHRLGESNLDRPTFAATQITAYASPDSTHATLADTIAAATSRVHIHVYELWEPGLVDAIVAAAHRGVHVAVLVEGEPVGLWSEDRAARDDTLHRIVEAGGEAVLAGNGRYRFHHLKVMVADDRVAVQSENWVASGSPPHPTTGNRGWGMLVQSPSMANWFAAWMADDRNAWDAEPFDDSGSWEPVARFPARTGPYGPVVDAKTWTGTFQVMPVVSPDHTADPAWLTAFLANRSRIWVQQLDLDVEWANNLGWTAPDALMTGLLAARGDVRVMAAAPFHADDTENARMLDRLREAGHLAREFERDGVRLHNKAILADDTVFLGSMNGNHHSRAMNREVGLVVTDAEIAAWYGELFLADWDASAAAKNPVWDDLESIPASLPTLFAALLLARLRRPC